MNTPRTNTTPRLPSVATTAHVPRLCGISLKYLSLVVLVIQNSSLALLMRYSRTIQSGEMYIASTAVFSMEIVKLLTCLLLLLFEKRSLDKFLLSLRRDVGDYGMLWLMMIPSALYAIQNNLLYVALSNLDAATFQVSYQLKILTTALFSKWMLNKHLNSTHWLSLCLLMVGVCLVQMQSFQSAATVRTEERRSELHRRSDDGKEDPMPLPQPNDDASYTRRKLAAYINLNERQELQPNEDTSQDARLPESNSRIVYRRSYSSDHEVTSHSANEQSPLMGMLSVLAACMSSGFAGCYFEKLLKYHGATQSSSLWVRNIQLGVFGTLFSGTAMMLNDGSAVLQRGFFVGYNAVTWMVIVNQAVGGLLVAMAVKYADNILKGFATSVSVIVSGVLSVVLFGFVPSSEFIMGTTIVLAAVIMYSKAELRPLLPPAHPKE